MVGFYGPIDHLWGKGSSETKLLSKSLNYWTDLAHISLLFIPLDSLIKCDAADYIFLYASEFIWLLLSVTSVSSTEPGPGAAMHACCNHKALLKTLHRWRGGGGCRFPVFVPFLSQRFQSGCETRLMWSISSFIFWVQGLLSVSLVEFIFPFTVTCRFFPFRLLIAIPAAILYFKHLFIDF